MSGRREKKYDSTDSELEDWQYEYYNDLRDGKKRVRVSEGVFRCPYCDYRDYDYSDIRRHASRIGNDLKHSRLKDRAKHLGLLRYLDRQIDSKGVSSRSGKNYCSKRDGYVGEKRKPSRSPAKSPIKYEENHNNEKRTLIPTSRADELQDGCQDPVDTAFVNSNEDTKLANLASGQSNPKNFKRSEPKTKEELIVYPWMAIVANVPTEFKGGRMVGRSGANHKAEWVAEGFNPVKVQPVWGPSGHSGFEVVSFEKDWEGFKNAMMFEKAFEAENRGKKDWSKLRNRGDALYGWIARSEDYNQRNVVGRYLSKNGDLKSVSEIEMEDKVKGTKLVSNLVSTLETKNKKCEEMKKKISKTEMRVKTVMEQKEEMTQNYNDELAEMKRKSRNQLEHMLKEHERSKSHLEAKRRQLDMVAKDLQQREALNESELEKLNREKKMNESAILEQQKADESMMKLAEEQKKEKEKLHKRILELEKQLDAKQALELEIARLKGAKEVTTFMSEDGDPEQKKKLESIKEELAEKEEELENIEALNQTLVIKERKTNDELQEGRKELIGGLKDSRASIRVKRMGELDEKPFLVAAERKYQGEKDMKVKAMDLFSTWEDYVRDPSWHPFKVVAVEDHHEEVIDLADEKLKSLKDELGDEPYEAVITALKELNEYNPSGRYPLPELWNSNEGRKASMQEGCQLIVKQWKVAKKNKRKRG